MLLPKTWLLITILLTLSAQALAVEPDWSAYSAALKKIHPGTKNQVDLALVDYSGLKKSGLIKKAYQALTSYPLANLKSQEEKLAFYINAYNILALKTVVDHWPLKSIEDIGDPANPVWGKPAGRLGGVTYSLDELENKILRPMAEPRVHFAIVCASVSCPDLRNEPYKATKLNEQLDDQVKKFLANTGKGLRVESKAIYTSQIFDWFSQDFEPVGGYKAFLQSYQPELPLALPVKFLNYDWDVNGALAKPSKKSRKKAVKN